MEEIALSLKDKDKKEVVWYKKSHDQHIYHKHVDLKMCKNLIPKAIKSPQLKYYDNKRNCIHYYYLARINYKGDRLYMEVIVNYNEKPARIKTAHITSNINKAAIC
jgi:hypothetical protein